MNIIQIDQRFVQIVFSIKQKAKPTFYSEEMIDLCKISFFTELFSKYVFSCFFVFFFHQKYAHCGPEKAGPLINFIFN